MEELTKDVLVTEKWNNSLIDKDNDEKELEKMVKTKVKKILLSITFY